MATLAACPGFSITDINPDIMVPWNSARTKVQLKLSVQRTKMLQEKKEAMAKKSRRDIAALVEKGKLETARIKTEGIIAEDIHIELLELMELYVETLLARFALLDLNIREPDPAILPALAAVIHAAPRTELKELHVLREMLMSKFGRDFAVDCMENRDGCVPDRIMSKLVIGAGSDPVLVDAYIQEICRAYDVPFHSDVLSQSEETKADEAAVEAETEGTEAAAGEEPAADKAEPAVKAEKPSEPTAPVASAKKTTEEDDYNTLAARFAALKRK